ncbi:MAG: MFS transporter [Porticoccaceae bacterium]
MSQAWRVLAAACVIYFLNVGAIYYGLAVVLKPLIEVMGWTRAQGTSGITVFMLTMGLLGPAVAALIERVDVRNTVFIGAVAILLGAVTGYFTQGLVQFYVALALLGFGATAVTFIPMSQLVARWFSQRRGLGLGILIAAAGLGAFIMTPLFALVLERTGDWRMLFAIMGATAPISVVLTLLVIRNKPPVDADVVIASNTTAAPEARVYQSSLDWTLRAALRTRALWVIVAAFGMGVLGLNLVNSQAILHLTDQGIGQVLAGAAIGTMGLLSVAGRLGGGILGDRLEPRFLLAAGLLFQAAGILTLLFTDRDALVYAFALLFGVGFGLGIVTGPLMLANYFGVGSFARINAATGVITMGLTAFGPTIAGHVSDTLDSYTWVFGTFSALAVLLAVPLVLLKPPAPPRTSGQPLQDKQRGARPSPSVV